MLTANSSMSQQFNATKLCFDGDVAQVSLPVVYKHQIPALPLSALSRSARRNMKLFKETTLSGMPA